MLLFAELIEEFENPYLWATAADRRAKIQLEATEGKQGYALLISYDFTEGGSWVVAYKDFRMDFTNVEEISLFVRVKGDTNKFQIKLEIPDVGNAYAQTVLSETTGWEKLSFGKKDFTVEEGFSWSDVKRISFSIVSEAGGSGQIALDNLEVKYRKAEEFKKVLIDDFERLYPSDFWKTKMTTGSISLESTKEEAKEGNYSMKVSYSVPEGTTTPVSFYWTGDVLNWEGARQVSVWIKGQGFKLGFYFVNLEGKKFEKWTVVNREDWNRYAFEIIGEETVEFGFEITSVGGEGCSGAAYFDCLQLMGPIKKPAEATPIKIEIPETIKRILLPVYPQLSLYLRAETDPETSEFQMNTRARLFVTARAGKVAGWAIFETDPLSVDTGGIDEDVSFEFKNLFMKIDNPVGGIYNISFGTDLWVDFGGYLYTKDSIPMRWPDEAAGLEGYKWGRKGFSISGGWKKVKAFYFNQFFPLGISYGGKLSYEKRAYKLTGYGIIYSSAPVKEQICGAEANLYLGKFFLKGEAFYDYYQRSEYVLLSDPLNPVALYEDNIEKKGIFVNLESVFRPLKWLEIWLNGRYAQPDYRPIFRSDPYWGFDADELDQIRVAGRTKLSFKNLAIYLYEKKVWRISKPGTGHNKLYLGIEKRRLGPFDLVSELKYERWNEDFEILSPVNKIPDRTYEEKSTNLGLETSLIAYPASSWWWLNKLSIKGIKREQIDFEISLSSKWNFLITKNIQLLGEMKFTKHSSKEYYWWEEKLWAELIITL